MSSVAAGYERLCRVVLIIFVVNCSMVVHTLLGAVIGGLMPSVGAAVATYRTWLLDEDRAWSARRTLLTFHEAWRTDLAGANAFGWAQAGVGLLLAWDYYLANWNSLGGAAGIAVSGVLLMVNAAFAVVALTSWVVRAHLDAPWRVQVRTAAAVAVSRPRYTGALTALLVATAWTWSRWPGTAVAFGLSLPVFAVVAAAYAFGRIPGMDARAGRGTTGETGPAAPVPAGAHGTAA